MKTITIDRIYETLQGYESFLVLKAKNEIEKDNMRKAEIYSAKANAVRECVRLLSGIQ